MSFASPLGGPIASAFVEVTADTQKADQAIRAFLRSLTVDSIVAAERAGEAITNSFQEAARQSNLALRDIGGPTTFAPVVAQAEVASERIDNSFRDAARDSNLSLASIGRGALLVGGGLAVAGAALTAFGVSGAAALETTTIGFTSLLGSAEEADAFIREMQQFAATTPFEFQGLADNARRLLAVSEAIGLTREELIPTIGTIGDLTAVLGAPPDAIDRVVRALGQMGSRGKVTTEEMLQLAEALPGFQPFQAMADGLGLTTAELQEQISAGTIPATEGIEALLAGMREFPGAAGAMAAQAQTLTGVFSTFKDTISLALTEAFQPLVPTITSTLTEVLPAIEATLGTVAPALSTLAGTVLEALGDILRELGPAFGVALQGLADGLAVLGQRFGPALEPLSGALESLGPLFTSLATAVAPVLTVLGTLAGAVIPPLAAVLTGLFDALAPVISVLAEALLEIVDALRPVLATLGNALVAVLEQLSPILTTVAEIFSGVLVQAIETLAPVLAEVVEILGSGLQEVLTVLAPVIQELAEALAERFLATLEALAPVLPDLAEALVEIAVALAELLVAVLPLIVLFTKLETVFIQRIGAPVLLAIAQAVAFLATALAGLVSLIAGAIEPTFNALSTAVLFLWQSVLVPLGGFLSTVFTIVLQTLATIFQTVIVPAIQLVTTVATFLWQNVLTPLFGFIQTFVLPVLGLWVAIMLGPLFAAITLVINTAMFLWRNVLEPLFGFISANFIPVVTFLAGVLSGVLSAAIGTVTSLLGFLYTNVFQPVAGFLTGVFNVAIGAFQGAWSLASSAIGTVRDTLSGFYNNVIVPAATFIRDTFKPVIDGLRSAFNLLDGPIDTVSDAIDALGDVISTVIGFVNDLIDAIGDIEVPDITPGFDVPGVPLLQHGGIGNFGAGTPAILHGREAVLPLDDLRRSLQILNATGLFRRAAFQSSTGSQLSGELGLTGAPTVNVTVNAPGATRDDADTIATATADATVLALERRRLTFSARTAS